MWIIIQVDVVGRCCEEQRLNGLTDCKCKPLWRARVVAMYHCSPMSAKQPDVGLMELHSNSIETNESSNDCTEGECIMSVAGLECVTGDLRMGGPPMGSMV